MKKYIVLVCVFCFLLFGFNACKPVGGIDCPGFKDRTATRPGKHAKLSNLQKGKSGIRKTREVRMSRR